MSDLIAQAQTSAAVADWSTVIGVLQRLCLAESGSTLNPEQRAQLLPLALSVLEAGDFHEQWEVAKVFSSFGRAAIAPLTTLLQDDTAELEARWFAARILGELNDPDAIQALVEQLQTVDDEDLNPVVAEALAHLGPSAIAALSELLETETTRLFAVQALAQIHQSAIVPPLLSVVDDPDATIRAIVIETLSSFQDDRIPPRLLAAVKDPAAIVRKAAIAGLSTRKDLAQSEPLVELLVDRLWDVNVSVCQQAALALGKLKRDEAVPALQRALVSPHTSLPLQLDLVRALSWVGTESALTGLQACLPPQNMALPAPVRQEILTLLGRWEQPDLKPLAAQVLITVLQHTSDAALRRVIATALGELKHPAGLDSLIRLLGDDHAGVQLHAIAALKLLDPTAAYHRLTDLQASPELPERLRAGVAVALREWETELPL